MDFSGFVYNLGVEGDQSFVAEGIGVHNCTAHGWPAAIEIQRRAQGLEPLMPSRNFFYYNERLVEGDISVDDGAQIRTGGKVGSQYGLPPESFWGYVTAKLGLRPSQTAYDEALKHRVSMYNSVQSTPEAICAALAAGKAVVFGFTVFSSFEGAEIAKTGVMKMPLPHEQNLGGHCVCAVGYKITDRTKATGIDGYFIIRNSWGVKWGQAGYFLMPFDYFRKGIASDPWVVSVVRG